MYSVDPIKNEIAKVCKAINFDPSDLKPLGLKQEAVQNPSSTGQERPQDASPSAGT